MSVSLSEKIKTIIALAKKPRTLTALISQAHSGYLFDIGWFNSFKTKTPVDKNNNPIPWATYPFIDFIEEKLNQDLYVFEFGSGNSTLFFAVRTKKVIAVEDDENWVNNIKSKLPKNAEIIFEKNAGKFSEVPKKLNNKFDIINIDGGDRNKCIESALKSLSEIGIIILDDSERKEYKKGIDLLLNSKFRRIDFWGIAPGILFKKCTTIFYKNSNCLGI